MTGSCRPRCIRKPPLLACPGATPCNPVWLWWLRSGQADPLREPGQPRQRVLLHAYNFCRQPCRHQLQLERKGAVLGSHACPGGGGVVGLLWFAQPLCAPTGMQRSRPGAHCACCAFASICLCGVVSTFWLAGGGGICGQTDDFFPYASSPHAYWTGVWPLRGYEGGAFMPCLRMRFFVYAREQGRKGLRERPAPMCVEVFREGGRAC